MHQSELILKSEALFAREVALGAAVTRPLKTWCYLIPGMFIIDFLRRQKAVRQFTRAYLFPRRQALYCAKAAMDGIGREQLEDQSKAHVAQWPGDNQGTAKESRALQFQVIELLIPHYRKLLTTRGSTYPQLLANAYPERKGLERFFEHLYRLERSRDSALPKVMKDGLWHRQLDAIHNQVDIRRKRMLDEVYPIVA
jgi:hypothetical protein